MESYIPCHLLNLLFFFLTRYNPLEINWELLKSDLQRKSNLFPTGIDIIDIIDIIQQIGITINLTENLKTNKLEITCMKELLLFPLALQEMIMVVLLHWESCFDLFCLQSNYKIYIIHLDGLSAIPWVYYSVIRTPSPTKSFRVLMNSFVFRWVCIWVYHILSCK